MTTDFYREYTLRCNKFSLLLIAGGLLLLLGASFAAGYWFGAGSVRPGADPLAALVVPFQRPTVTVPPGANGPEAGATAGRPEDGGLLADSRAGLTDPVRPAEERRAAVLPLPAAAGAWCIQLSARNDLAAAQGEVAALAGRGLQARLETVAGPDGPRYLVRLGEFRARAEAEQYAAALENRGLITDFIVLEK